MCTQTKLSLIRCCNRLNNTAGQGSRNLVHWVNLLVLRSWDLTWHVLNITAQETENRGNKLSHIQHSHFSGRKCEEFAVTWCQQQQSVEIKSITIKPFSAGAPPRTPLGELTTLSQTPESGDEGILVSPHHLTLGSFNYCSNTWLWRRKV